MGLRILPLAKLISPVYFMRNSCIITDWISGAVTGAVARHCHSLCASLWDHLLNPADRVLCGALTEHLKHVYLTFLAVALVRLRFNV